jgi:hypothetical protein
MSDFLGWYAVFLLICYVFVSEFTLTHVDEFIDELLTKDYCCDTALPRIQKRSVFYCPSVERASDVHFKFILFDTFALALPSAAAQLLSDILRLLRCILKIWV